MPTVRHVWTLHSMYAQWIPELEIRAHCHYPIVILLALQNIKDFRNQHKHDVKFIPDLFHKLGSIGADIANPTPKRISSNNSKPRERIHVYFFLLDLHGGLVV